MRLIENSDARGCSSGKIMVLVRHGVDVPVLSQDLNQPLTEETKFDVKILGKEIVKLCRTVGASKICVQHSGRLRAIQTATIAVEEFFTANIPTEMCETTGVREIYQGDFVIRNHVQGNEYKPLLDAWKAWQQKLDSCKLLYRFGDPVINSDGEAEYPELVGWFNKLGEHQGEFSLRLYLLLKSMFEKTGNELQIIIGHQASCSRIQRILSATAKLSSIDEFRPGDFVKYLEKEGSRQNIEPAHGIVVRKPERDLIIAILQKEIAYLRSIM